MADPALVAFIERMHPRLVGGISLHCGDASLAEELAQEALVRVWERWGSVAEMEHPEAWTWTVALNLARSRLRRRGAERRALTRVGVAPAHQDADSADAIAVRRAVAALPLRQRTALVYRHYAGFTVAETAAAMRCAPGTVKSLTNRAIGALRTILGAGELQAGEDEDEDEEVPRHA